MFKNVFLCLVIVTVQGTKLPTISLENLKAGDFDGAKNRDGEFGAFFVSDLPQEFQDSLERLMADAPGCLTRMQHHHMQHLPKTHMPDGSFRTTYATQDADFPSCLNMMAPLTDAFDQVEEGVSRLIQNACGFSKTLSYVTGDADSSVELKDAPVKDHVHVYERAEEVTGDLMVPYHTDNGIFLILTPFPGKTGLKIKLKDGTEIQTSEEIEPKSVLVLMGRGLTSWLLQDGGFPAPKIGFWPVPHAVPSMTDRDTRSVYARMKVAPGNAIPASLVRKEGSKRVKALKTFDDIFMESKLEPASICSVNLEDRGLNPKKSSWFKAMDDLCDEGSAYCWMSCMELPSGCVNPECYNSKTNISCRSDKSMDPGCEWHCDGKAKRDNDFCNGAMDMLMSGFEAAGADNSTPCVILFVKAWTLDTRVKFGFACIGVMFLGFCIELLIAVRRRLTSRRRLSPYLVGQPSVKRTVAIALFGLNLLLGYLAMLVAMTYSIELFLCVIIGLMIGHAVFNVKQSVGESVDPCCAPSQNAEDGGLIVATGHSGPVTRTPSPCQQSCSSRPSILRSPEENEGPSEEA